VEDTRREPAPSEAPSRLIGKLLFSLETALSSLLFTTGRSRYGTHQRGPLKRNSLRDVLFSPVGHWLATKTLKSLLLLDGSGGRDTGEKTALGNNPADR